MKIFRISFPEKFLYDVDNIVVMVYDRYNNTKREVIRMKGTEKQVKWAEDIRTALENHWVELEKEMGSAPELVRQYMSEVLGHEEAKYFIDHWKSATRKGFRLRDILESLEGEIGDAAYEWTDSYLKKVAEEKQRREQEALNSMSTAELWRSLQLFK